MSEFRIVNTHTLTTFVDLLLLNAEKYNVKLKNHVVCDDGTSKVVCSGYLDDLIKLDKWCQRLHDGL